MFVLLATPTAWRLEGRVAQRRPRPRAGWQPGTSRHWRGLHRPLPDGGSPFWDESAEALEGRSLRPSKRLIGASSPSFARVEVVRTDTGNTSRKDPGGTGDGAPIAATRLSLLVRSIPVLAAGLSPAD
jgi:hypothetical protein